MHSPGTTFVPSVSSATARRNPPSVETVKLEDRLGDVHRIHHLPELGNTEVDTDYTPDVRFIDPDQFRGIARDHRITRRVAEGGLNRPTTEQSLFLLV